MERVLLHVGLPKSGTSYLQRLMVANKQALAEAGVLFPGANWRDQVAAVRDVRRLAGGSAAVAGAWDRLVAESMAWSGTVVISMEWLAPANARQIERIVGAWAGAEVEVVFTARDIARTLPAAWQEFMQNGQTFGWDEFLDSVTGEDARDTDIGRMVWSQQDLSVLVERWVQHVPASRLYVVTVPPPGSPRDLLWNRFADVVGLDPAVATEPATGANESLGVESAELMRRMNRRAADLGVKRNAYNRALKHRLSKKVLARRKGEESALHLPPEYASWARAVADRHIAGVVASGSRVVGDLDELLPAVHLDAGRSPHTVGDDELLDVALAALLELTLRRNP